MAEIMEKGYNLPINTNKTKIMECYRKEVGGIN